jgi:hypothetical protein
VGMSTIHHRDQDEVLALEATVYDPSILDTQFCCWPQG